MNVIWDTDYRLVLFFSTDLIDSTLISEKSRKKSDDSSWANMYAHFYAHFPELLKTGYEEFKRKYNPDDIRGKGSSCYKAFINDEENNELMPWKLVGDEIVFCVQIKSKEQILFHICVVTFALQKYNEILQGSEFEMLKEYGKPACKGTLWLAGFPVNNAMISFNSNLSVINGSNIRDFDFIGPSMNTGFRLSKFSSVDKMSASVDVAYIASIESQLCVDLEINMFYYGKEKMKGVISDKPFPIFYFDARTISDRDDAQIHDSRTCDLRKASEFINKFYIDNNMCKPFVYPVESVPPVIKERKKIIEQRRKSYESDHLPTDIVIGGNVSQEVREKIDTLLKQIQYSHTIIEEYRSRMEDSLSSSQFKRPTLPDQKKEIEGGEIEKDDGDKPSSDNPTI